MSLRKANNFDNFRLANESDAEPMNLESLTRFIVDYLELKKDAPSGTKFKWFVARCKIVVNNETMTYHRQTLVYCPVSINDNDEPNMNGVLLALPCPPFCQNDSSGYLADLTELRSQLLEITKGMASIQGDIKTLRA